MKTAKTLLARLTRRWPPPKDCHHTLYLIADDALAVALNIDGHFQHFILDEADLDQDAAKLMKGIEKAWMQTNNPTCPMP